MRRSVAAAVLGVLIVLWPAVPADAAYSSTATGSGTARSTTMAAPGTLTATCNSLLAASVRLDWIASSSSFVTDYQVQWGTTAGSPTNSQIVTGVTFSTPALALGTWYFTVRSAKGGWRSATSNQPSRTIVTVLFVAACV